MRSFIVDKRVKRDFVEAGSVDFASWCCPQLACCDELGKRDSLCQMSFFCSPADGNYLLSCGSDKSLKLWSASRGTPLKTYSGHGYEVLDADR